MAQGAINLGLERIREFRVGVLTINGRSARRDSMVKRYHERIAHNSVGSVFQEEVH